MAEEVLIASCVGDGALAEGASAAVVPWWSITKTCLSACALVLAAQGRLDLDRRLGGCSFTLRHVLRHTSGLRCYTDRPDYEPAVDRNDDPWSEANLLTDVDDARLLFAPGQGWSYSNTGYLLVRRMIEQAARCDTEQALRTLVLEPLGIAGTSLARERADLLACAWGHEDGFHPGWVAHGLLIGPPADAALFMHRLFTTTLLPAPLLAAMCERHPVEAALAGRPWRTAGYGLGLMMDVASPHGRCIGHTGQGPESTAAAYHFPDLDPPLTVAAFAPTSEQAVVECAVLETAGSMRRGAA